MPFKIIQTIEDGEMCLCVVPAGWESDGVLRWPKKSAVSKLSQDENSIPNEKWERINCVKKREFGSRAEADRELLRMESMSDTEADEIFVGNPAPMKKARQGNPNNRSIYSIVDFNDLVQQEGQSAHQQLVVATAVEDENMVIKLSACIAECRVLIFIHFQVNQSSLLQTESLMVLPDVNVDQCSEPTLMLEQENEDTDNLLETRTDDFLETVLSNQHRLEENQ